MIMPNGEPKPSSSTTKRDSDNQIADELFKGLDENISLRWREVPPSHYLWKIDSFSSLVGILKKTGLNHYESKEFDVGGYDWKLLLYPEEGDKKRNQSDQISLYLKLISSLRMENEINALVIFFVYDQLNNRYLSIQDTKVRRIKSENSQQVSLNCFKINASNGFLVNNSCVFGVEIFVMGSGRKEERFCTLQQSEKAYVWNVDKFSQLKEDLFSKPIVIGDYQWKVHLYRKGISKANVKAKYLSIYLCLDQSKMSFGQKMHVEFKISINDLVHENQSDKITKRGNAWFSASEKAWGFPYFIKLDDLQNSKSLILRDAMEIELQIVSMSMAMVNPTSFPRRIMDDFEEGSDDDFPSMPLPPPM